MVLGVRTLPFDIPKQYPIQESLETKHQPTTCKLTLPLISKMKILRRASRDPWALSHKWERDNLWHQSNRIGHQVQGGPQSSRVSNIGPRHHQDRPKQGPHRQLEQASPLLTRPTSSRRQRARNPHRPWMLKLRQHMTEPKRQKWGARALGHAWHADCPALWKSPECNPGRRLWRFWPTQLHWKTCGVRCMKRRQGRPKPPSWIECHSTSSGCCTQFSCVGEVLHPKHSKQAKLGYDSAILCVSKSVVQLPWEPPWPIQ